MTRPSRNPTTWISTVVGTVIGVLGAVFVASRLVSEWPEVRAALGSAAWWWTVPATLLAGAGMTWHGLQWRACLQSLGNESPRLQVLTWYFIGQLGKYIPGGVWPVLGRGELAHRGGVARPVAYNSVALSMAITYLAASVAVVALVPLGQSGEGGTWWLLLVVPVGLVLLHPVVLGRLLMVAEKVMGDGSHPLIPSWSTTLALIVRHVPGWLLIGLSTWMVARAFDPDAPLVPVVAAGIFSWIVGFVAIPVPGGLGVREAAFVAAAGGLAGPVAATVAVVSRVVFVLVDALGALLAAGPLRMVANTNAGTAPDTGRDTSEAPVSGSPEAAPSVPPDAAR